MNQRVTAIVVALSAGLGGAYYLRHQKAAEEAGSVEVAPPTAKPPRPAPTSGPAARPDTAAPATAKTAGPAKASATVAPPSTSTTRTDEIDFAAELVPLDAFLYVRAESIASLQQAIREATSDLDPMMASMADPRGLLQMLLGPLGADPSQIDAHQPLGIALSMPGGAQKPVVTAILPVSSPRAFVDGLRLPQGLAEPQTRGNYVGIAMGPNYRLGSKASPLATDLLPGQIALRLRMAPIRGIVQEAIKQMPDTPMNGMGPTERSAYIAGRDFGRRFYEIVDEVEFGVQLDAEGIELHAGTTFADDSSMALPVPREAIDLTGLARFVGEDDEFVTVGSWSPEFLQGPLRELIETAREASRGTGTTLSEEKVDQVFALLPMAGSQVLTFGSFDVGAMHAGVVMRPPVPDPIVDAIGSWIEGSDLGVLLLEPAIEQGIEDGRMLRLRIGLETGSEEGWTPEQERSLQSLALLCGSREAELRILVRGGDLGVFFSSDEAWMERMTARLGVHEMQVEGQQPDGFAAKFSELGAGSPNMYYRVDVGGLVREFVRLSAEHMGLDPSEDLAALRAEIGDEPLTIESTCWARGPQWRGSSRLDWRRLGKLAAALSGRE